jgi:outer membrane protein TolC
MFGAVNCNKPNQSPVESGANDFPTSVVGAQGRNYSGNGDFRQAEVMLGFTFPWGNAGKYRADRERADALTLTAEQEAADYALELQEEIHLLTVRIDAARREALLYQDEIVPRSERALESAQAAWISNRGLFLEVLDARRMLLDARLMQAGLKPNNTISCPTLCFAVALVISKPSRCSGPLRIRTHHKS